MLHENLYALVKVGRFAQAERVVRRLAQIYQPGSPELVDAHHRLLTGRLESLLNHPTKAEYAVMQRWFELDIRGRDCEPNSAILAIMIKATFAILEGSRLDRTIRRYISIAEQLNPEMKNDTIASGIFLTSEETHIINLFPQDYHRADESVATERLEEQVEALAQTKSSQYTSENAVPVLAAGSPAELRPVEQKGLGLRALNNSLLSFYPNAANAAIAEEAAQQDKSPAYIRQEHLERDVLASALKRWREEADTTREMRARGKLSDPMLGAYVYEWIQQMAKIVRDDIKKGEETEGSSQSSGVNDERLLLAPFLRMADPEKLCASAVVEYLNYVFDPKDTSSSDRPLTQMVAKLGKTLWQEIEMQGAKKSMLEKYHSLPSAIRHKRVTEMMKKQTQFMKSQSGKQYLEDQVMSHSPFGDRETTALKIKLGAKFLSLFMQVAKLPVTKVVDGKKLTQVQPVTIQALKWHSGKKHGILRTNQALIDRLKKEPVGSFIAKHLPMIIEPLPWKSLEDGAYLHSKLKAVRFRDTSRSQQEYVEMATKRGDMKQTYAGLDVIGKVPWRINRPLFDVLAEAWNSGEAIGKLAPENPAENWPEKPPEDDIAATRRWKSLIRTAQNERTGFHSQRCYQNFQLEVGKAFLNDTFYCPHNVDFRGRAYPIPPYFNHMGADYVRGLFLFARGKELGETGLRWLKIHLSNVYGFDKASLRDREGFTMEHLTDIYDSASNPLGGKRWWLTAEDPWQCLAACMEVKAALESPIPAKYVSHLPVQQDGTCNGLQHYAALGGDIIGAQQVNLMPGDRPADIYSAVADMVKEYVSVDAAKGNMAAQLLDGRITRKVVKQPVMTNVYGVTYHGARAQVRKQLVEILPKASLDNDIHHGQLAAYIATLIFKALSRMFSGAHAIQHWLGDCGGRISQSITPEQISRIKARRAGTLEEPQKLKLKRVRVDSSSAASADYQFKSTIVWTTPLGMPVVQPYRAMKHRSIRTSLQDVHISDSSASDPVSKRKQLQGFPPNFIHSLDATHMMLSALKCDEIGLQFSSVHDSFWTHAADVPIMNRVLRDAFVRMHSEDVIGRLREEFMARYKGCLHYQAIDARSALGRKISAIRRTRGSERAFGTAMVKEGAQIDELLEEYERQRLLKSYDTSEREKGAEMVTPASLLEAEGDPASYELGGVSSEVQLLGDEGGKSAGISDPGDEIETDVVGDEPDIAVPGVNSAATDSYEDVQERDIAAADAEASKVEEQVRDEIDESIAARNAATAAADNTSGKTSKKGSKGDSTDATAAEQETTGKKSGKPGPKTSKTSAAQKKHANKARNKMFLWVPISFPPAPVRGEFDVSTLKDSQYFFS